MARNLEKQLEDAKDFVAQLEKLKKNRIALFTIYGFSKHLLDQSTKKTA